MNIVGKEISVGDFYLLPGPHRQDVRGVVAVSLIEGGWQSCAGSVICRCAKNINDNVSIT
jgi:hypothetical protein